jgi:hypothetical protein
MQRKLAVVYRSSGTAYPSILQGQAVQHMFSFRDTCHCKMTSDTK